MLYVTGITGHSGRWFLKRLEAENYSGKIRCTMRQSREAAPEKYELFENCTLDLEFAVGDLTDETFLRQSLEGVNILVHTAGIDKSPDIVKAAIANKVGWGILVHTTGRFSKYKSASAGYIKIEDDILRARDKLLAFTPPGEMKNSGGMNCTILRPTMIYGSSADRNMYRLINYLAKYKVFPLFGDGGNLMQPVHARDLGNAYFDVMNNHADTMNKQYDLSGKSPITYIEIIRCIIRLLGSRVKIIHLSMKFSIFMAKIYNRIFGDHAVITVEQVLRMQEDKAFDHKAASKDFGYAPISFEEGIAEEVREYRNGTRVDFK